MKNSSGPNRLPLIAIPAPSAANTGRTIPQKIRVAYTSQWPHQTDIDTVDSTVIDLCAISTLFFQRQGYARIGAATNGWVLKNSR